MHTCNAKLFGLLILFLERQQAHFSLRFVQTRGKGAKRVGMVGKLSCPASRLSWAITVH